MPRMETASSQANDPGAQPPADRPRKFLIQLPNSVLFVALAFALGLGLGYLLWGNATTPAAPQAATLADVLIDDDPALGSPKAPVTIVEFSDYECPYCRKWQNEVWPQIQAAYPTQVRLVYRDFPLAGIHANAVPAAEAANCAGDQGRYWDYHKRLFTLDEPIDAKNFADYAEQLGMDRARFEACLQDGSFRDEVVKDYQDGNDLGITGTPTFFVNGYRIVGALPFEAFQQVIEQMLEQGQ